MFSTVARNTKFLARASSKQKFFSTSPQVANEALDLEEVDKLDKRLFKAKHAFMKSCYLNIDWKIDAESTTTEAMKVMTANRIGALAVTEGDKVVGIVSERDIVSKVAYLDKDFKDTTVKAICTYGDDNLVSVSSDASLDACMDALLNRDIRHLLVKDNNKPDSYVGMISIKDVVKCVVDKHAATMDNLEKIIQTQDMLRYQM
jgi:signal-transduction protein with cAMP-binding, CBS, and nucleotidyltransferase domain